MVLSRIDGKGPKRKVGGFVYAAHAGANAARFGGVLGEGRRLTAGINAVEATAGVEGHPAMIATQPGRPTTGTARRDVILGTSGAGVIRARAMTGRDSRWVCGP